MNSDELRSLTLSRLSRSKVWTETGRQDGYSLLVGVRGAHMASLAVDRGVLCKLLCEGAVRSWRGTRVVYNTNYVIPRPVKLKCKYYSVVNKE